MPLKIGFIGTDAIASIHLRNLSRMRDVRIVAAYDVVQEKTRKIALAANKSIQSGKDIFIKKLEDKIL